MWSAISTELLVADERSRPFISSMARGDLTWVGLDVHKDSIQMGILRRGSDAVEQRAIFHDEASVHKAFVRGLGPRSRLRVCDEAGPTSYGLARQLQQMGIACQVIAPSLIPKAPGDKVKTDETPGGSAGSTGRASWSAPGSPRPKKMRCATCAGHEPTWSRTDPGPKPALEVPASPLGRVARRVDLDARAPPLARACGR